MHRVLKYPDATDDEEVAATVKINVSGRQVQSHKDPLRWEDLERAFARLGGRVSGRCATRPWCRAVVPEAVGYLETWLEAAAITQGRQAEGALVRMARARTNTRS